MSTSRQRGEYVHEKIGMSLAMEIRAICIIRVCILGREPAGDYIVIRNIRDETRYSRAGLYSRIYNHPPKEITWLPATFPYFAEPPLFQVARNPLLRLIPLRPTPHSFRIYAKLLV